MYSIIPAVSDPNHLIDGPIWFPDHFLLPLPQPPPIFSGSSKASDAQELAYSRALT